MEKLTINRWAEEDRPREKMTSKGAQALSDAELLAILIGSGSDEDSAVGLMQKVLAEYGNSLDRVGRLSVEELCRFKGIGPAKAITMKNGLPVIDRSKCIGCFCCQEFCTNGAMKVVRPPIGRLLNR